MDGHFTTEDSVIEYVKDLSHFPGSGPTISREDDAFKGEISLTGYFLDVQDDKYQSEREKERREKNITSTSVESTENEPK